MYHLHLFLALFLVVSVYSHPVWDISEIVGNSTANILEPDDPRGILDFIDNIISGRMVISCATAQGQAGRCSIGSCATLGDVPATKCSGKLSSFLKCCPYQQATEVTPDKVSGKFCYIQSDKCNFAFSYKGCGVRPVRASNLIVGGHESVAHSWPWAIALYRVNGDRKFFQCGGSIINKRYILTAAHCIKRPFQTLTAKDFSVKVGAHYLQNSGDFVEIEEIIGHENYSPTYHNDDIALLRLKTPLNFHDTHVAPVCLPEPGSQLGRTVGQMATMVGWGVHSQTDFASSPSLFEVQVPISEQGECKKVYTELMGDNGYLNWNNTVCAYNPPSGGKDTCQGDSGGPMAIAGANEVYTQVGIVSFGYGCAQEGYPGVYTFVANYLNWIGSHMTDI